MVAVRLGDCAQKGSFTVFIKPSESESEILCLLLRGIQKIRSVSQGGRWLRSLIWRVVHAISLVLQNVEYIVSFVIVGDVCRVMDSRRVEE